MTEVDTAACAEAYRELRERVVTVVRAAEPTALDAIAEATPEWRVRDVLAHMVGVNTDIINQNLEGVATDPWTHAQVERSRELSIDALLDEWEASASVVEANAAFLGPAAGQWVLDACTHEHDVRQALGVPGARDSRAVAIGFDWGTDRLGEQLDRLGEPGVRLDTPAGAKAVGTNEPRNPVAVDRFEIVRAMTGRRSAAQMRAYGWRGDARPEDLVLSIFAPRSADFVE